MCEFRRVANEFLIPILFFLFFCYFVFASIAAAATAAAMAQLSGAHNKCAATEKTDKENILRGKIETNHSFIHSFIGSTQHQLNG